VAWGLSRQTLEYESRLTQKRQEKKGKKNCVVMFKEEAKKGKGGGEKVLVMGVCCKQDSWGAGLKQLENPRQGNKMELEVE